MLSRVFNTARQILSRSPSVQGRSEECVQEESIRHEANTDITMVTTRSGNGTGTSVEITPRSSVKKNRRKRELDYEETPTAKKKRRQSVDTEKDISDESNEVLSPTNSRAEEKQDVALDAPAVSIPDRTITERKDTGQPQPPSSVRRGRPMVVIPKKPSTPSASQQSTSKREDEEPSITQESIFYTPGTHLPSPEFVTPAMYRDAMGSPTPKPSKTSTPPLQEDSNNHLINQDVKILDEGSPFSRNEERAPTPTQGSGPTASAEKLHKRFDSEEAAETQSGVADSVNLQSVVDVQADDNDDDDASDSDEAPEIVATATAATKAKAIQDDAARAQKAAQDKDELRKQKRAQRMAEEQAEKRKREEARAKKLAKQEAKEEQRRKKHQGASSPDPRLGTDMTSLPALLPDSILEAVGSHRPPTPPPVRAGKSAEQIRKDKLQRHIKFLEQGEKSVKDVKKGSVNVAVLARQNALLAPKVKRDTKNIREHWLKGRQQASMGRKGNGKMKFRKMERKAVGGGFLRDRDD